MKTAAVERRIKALDEILTGILSLSAFTFDALKVTLIAGLRSRAVGRR
jgi:hypothetical protein